MKLQANLQMIYKKSRLSNEAASYLINFYILTKITQQSI